MIRLGRMTDDIRSRCALAGFLKGVIMLTACQHFLYFPLCPRPEEEACFLTESRRRWRDTAIFSSFRDWLRCLLSRYFRTYLQIMCHGGKVKDD